MAVNMDMIVYLTCDQANFSLSFHVKTNSKWEQGKIHLIAGNCLLEERMLMWNVIYSQYVNTYSTYLQYITDCQVKKNNNDRALNLYALASI